jgi:hypothetical protein
MIGDDWANLLPISLMTAGGLLVAVGMIGLAVRKSSADEPEQNESEVEQEAASPKHQMPPLPRLLSTNRDDVDKSNKP